MRTKRRIDGLNGPLTCLVLAVVCAVATGPARADEPATLHSGARIRIWQANSENSKYGKLVSGTAETVVVEYNDGDPVSIPSAQIESLQMSAGKHGNFGKGALIGGSIGFALGAALGIAMASDDFFDTDGGDVAVLALGGAVGGATVGGLIGLMITSEDWIDVDRPWQTAGERSGPVFRVTFALPLDHPASPPAH